LLKTNYWHLSLDEDLLRRGAALSSSGARRTEGGGRGTEGGGRGTWGGATAHAKNSSLS